MKLFCFALVLAVFCAAQAHAETMPAADAATLDDSAPAKTSAANSAQARKPNGNEKLPYSEQELNNYDPAQFQKANNPPVDTD